MLKRNKTILDKELKLIWEWQRNAFPYYLWLFLAQWRYCKFSPPVYGYMIYKNKIANAYLDIETLNKAAQTIVGKVQKDSHFLKRWRNFVFKTGREVHGFCDKVEKVDIRKLSDKALLKIYQESIKKYLDHTDGVAVIRNSNRLLQEKITRVYQNPSTVALLLSTDEESFILREHKDLIRIAEKTRKKQLPANKIEKLLNKHTKKYFYLPCGYSDEKLFTIADFKKRFKKILKSKETLKDFQKKLKQQTQEREKVISKLKPPKPLKRLIDFGSTCTYFKDFIRGNLNRLQYFNRKIFKEIGRRTDNSWKDIACLIPDEVNNVLKNKKRIKKRKEAVLFSDRQGIHLLLGKEAKKKIKEIKKSTVSKTSKEIKGIEANPGKTKGKVLLVHKVEDAKGKKDFILVSPMTTPDLVPAAKKAKAIITDEGGLTCHAAIVSRELKIPCIVGTKIATKILKDEDLVEVDANKGVVKIIKRRA